VASAAPPAVRPGGPALPEVVVREIAKGVFHMTGQTHHSMLVEFSDHMVLIEAPNEGRVLAVLAKARELRPNKPVTALVVSHHHSDHTSGVRAAVAEGINEIIIHTKNIPYVQELLRRPWTIAPDALAKKPNPKPVKFTGVSDSLVLKDNFNEVQLHYVLDNTHSDNMLSIYFPNGGIYTQADIYMPDDPRNIVAGYPEGHAPWVQNVYQNIVFRKINVQQHVPLHGEPVPQSQFLESALRLQLMNPLKKPSTN
jgi:glyoxylase-like metal-dependent hydrolase (beta-lactamase superfamily II)